MAATNPWAGWITLPEVKVRATPEEVADATEAKSDAPWDPFDGIPAEYRAMALSADRFRGRWEKTIAGIISRHWERQSKVMVAKMKTVQFRKDTSLWSPPGPVRLETRIDMIFDEAEWDKALADDLRQALQDLHDEAAAQLDEVVQVKAVSIIDFIEQWILHALGFNRRARRKVFDYLSTQPTSVPEVEERVKEYVSKTMHLVGNQVATSIATGAVNEAQTTLAQRAGISERIWFSAQDSKVRPSHRAANGQTRGTFEPFILVDRRGVPHPMMHPGDTTAPADLWINCRCVTLFVTPASSQLWRRADGSVIDPYGRGGLEDLAVVKSYPAERLGLTWPNG